MCKQAALVPVIFEPPCIWVVTLIFQVSEALLLNAGLRSGADRPSDVLVGVWSLPSHSGCCKIR